MRISFHKLKNTGFAAAEGLLIVVMLVAIAGIGAYVLHQKKIANNTLSSTKDSGTTTQTTTQPALGSTASIDKLTQQDGQTEAGVDSSADNQTSQNATSSNGAVNNVGGSYDESTL